MPRKRIKTRSMPLLGPPVQDEASIRTVLLIGSLVLLLLFAGIGYWSSRNYLSLEDEIDRIYQTDSRHGLLVLEIQSVAGEIWAEARNIVGTLDQDYLNRAAKNRLSNRKHEMNNFIESARKTGIREWSEWKEFEQAYKEYIQIIESPESSEWEEKRGRMTQAIQGLKTRVEDERRDHIGRTHAMSVERGNTVLLATVAAVSFGILVIILTFYEIHRILARLGKARKASAESRDFLQSLFDSMISGGVVVDKAGTVVAVSDSFRKLAGLGQSVAVGESYKKLFSDNPSLADVITKDLDQQFSGNRYCGRITPVNGQLFDLFCSPILIGGEYRGVALSFVDITEIEKAQSELRRNRALVVVGQMTTQIAHEIKNPLGSIRFAVDLLRRSNSIEEKDHQTLEMINRSVAHLTNIVTELSEFARPKSLNRTEVNINDLLDDLDPMLADRLNTKGLVIEKDFDPDLPIGHYDATELRKLFLNLIINAIDATETGGRIRLKTSHNGEGALDIEVADNGSGMDKETLQRLFEPFYTTKKQGTGLGMAISKNIADLHLGDLRVVSRQGEGTTVMVRLPVDYLQPCNSVESESADKSFDRKAMP